MPLKSQHESNQIALRALRHEDFSRLVDWINTALERAGFSLVAERKLESKCPSDAGKSRIYAIRRRWPQLL